MFERGYRLTVLGLGIVVLGVLAVAGCGPTYHPMAEMLAQSGAPDCREHIVTFQAEKIGSGEVDVELYSPQRTFLFEDISISDGIAHAYRCSEDLQGERILFVIDGVGVRFPVRNYGDYFSQHTKRVRLTINGPAYSSFSVWNHRGKMFLP